MLIISLSLSLSFPPQLQRYMNFQCFTTVSQNLQCYYHRLVKWGLERGNDSREHLQIKFKHTSSWLQIPFPLVRCHLCTGDVPRAEKYLKGWVVHEGKYGKMDLNCFLFTLIRFNSTFWWAQPCSLSPSRLTICAEKQVLGQWLLLSIFQSLLKGSPGHL